MLNLSPPEVSLIIPVKNEGTHIQNTIKSALNVQTRYSFEIIVIDDASTDGCCDFLPSYAGRARLKLIRSIGVGLARAKNLGALKSSGQYLIFCDAHVFFEDYWLDRLLQPIRDGIADATTPGIADITTPDLCGYGQTLNKYLGVEWNIDLTELTPIAVIPGGCYAVSRSLFFDIGGFDNGFKVWGYEDVEISMRMWLFGYTCWVQPEVKILHVFRKTTPYQVNLENVYFNMLGLAFNHFKEERIETCKMLIQNSSQIELAILRSGFLEQRKAYFSRRKHDDDWYMKKFEIPF
ncbi:glycosyltransferase family 2 protein [Paenibacillus chitinolyticus]|uniref:glycosyltransferase family 2 protein n=1 Tax=Paenibacillus chitinolyticus TaxID=79263 RepID=UPI003625DA41